MKKFRIGDRVRVIDYPEKTGVVEKYVRNVNPDDWSIYWEPWIRWDQRSIIWIHGPYREDAFELIEREQEDLL